MLLGNKYMITADKNNIILSEKKIITGKGTGASAVNRKQAVGTVVWEEIGFYSTFHYAVRGFIHQELRSTGFPDADTVLKKIDELYSLVKTLPEFTVADIKPKKIVTQETKDKMRESRRNSKLFKSRSILQPTTR